jgi:hypothetical protein
MITIRRSHISDCGSGWVLRGIVANGMAKSFRFRRLKNPFKMQRGIPCGFSGESGPGAHESACH